MKVYKVTETRVVRVIHYVAAPNKKEAAKHVQMLNSEEYDHFEAFLEGTIESVVPMSGEEEYNG